MDAKGDAQALVQRDRKQCADSRPEQHMHAAGDRGKDNLQRHRDTRNRLRVYVLNVLRQQASAEGGQRSADHGYPQFFAHHIDAARGGGGFVLGDRFERDARDAVVDPLPDGETTDPDHQRDDVKIALLRELQRIPGVANRLQASCRASRRSHRAPRSGSTARPGSKLMSPAQSNDRRRASRKDG